jgi:hypothetical protein
LYQYDLSICAIFRDEAPYLREWIEFHRLVGVQHFYLCSHASVDHYKEILQPYINQGIVDLTELQNQDLLDIENFNILQSTFYTNCLNLARGVSQWVAFIDVDEFLFPIQEDSLVHFLKKYEEYGGVTANWLMFGTSWVDKVQENELMIEMLTRCAPLDFGPHVHIKSIVQPIYVNRFYNPHYAEYAPGYFQVDTDKQPSYGPFNLEIKFDQLRINHYWMKDEDYFFNIKLPRRLQWNHPLEDLMNTREVLNQEVDKKILKYVPRLKQRLNKV